MNNFRMKLQSVEMSFAVFSGGDRGVFRRCGNDKSGRKKIYPVAIVMGDEKGSTGTVEARAACRGYTILAKKSDQSISVDNQYALAA